MAMLLVIPLLLAGLVACNVHVDFDQVAQDFVNRKSAEIGSSVEWWDLYAQNKDMAKYQQYKIRTWVEQIKYGPVQSNSTAPGYSYIHWDHNGGSEFINSTYTRTVDLIDTFSWSITRGIRFSHPLSIGVHVPEQFSPKSAHSWDIDTGEPRMITHSEKFLSNYSVEYTVTTPANTSTKATLTITKQLMDIPFNTIVHVEGWIAIWFTYRWKGHYLRFFPIDQLADGRLRAVGPNHLVYHQEGMFHGSRDTTNLTVEEFPLDSESFLSEFPSARGIVDLPPIRFDGL